MKEAEMDKVAGFISRVLAAPEDARAHAAIKAEVEALCRLFPLYPDRKI
jgi:glycine hydroxymethyltransferase